MKQIEVEATSDTDHNVDVLEPGTLVSDSAVGLADQPELVSSIDESLSFNLDGENEVAMRLEFVGREFLVTINKAYLRYILQTKGVSPSFYRGINVNIVPNVIYTKQGIFGSLSIQLGYAQQHLEIGTFYKIGREIVVQPAGLAIFDSFSRIKKTHNRGFNLLDKSDQNDILSDELNYSLTLILIHELQHIVDYIKRPHLMAKNAEDRHEILSIVQLATCLAVALSFIYNNYYLTNENSVFVSAATHFLSLIIAVKAASEMYSDIHYRFFSQLEIRARKAVEQYAYRAIEAGMITVVPLAE